MNKKILFIIIAIVGVLLLLSGGTYLMRSAGNQGGVEGEKPLTFRDFVPFGGYLDKEPDQEDPVEDVDAVPDTPNTQETTDRLRRISTEPISGHYPLVLTRTIPETTTPDGTIIPEKKVEISSVRYTDKRTGHTIQTYLDEITLEKYTITTVPKIYQSYFTNKGEGVVHRYLNTAKQIETYATAFTKTDADDYATQSGTYLPKDLPEIAVSPDTTKMFYLQKVQGGITGTIASYKNEAKTQIFSSPFSDWTVAWPNTKIITLTTKPSARALGYMYGLDTSTRAFEKILGNIPGLTTLTSPDGMKVLYSNYRNNTLSFNVYDRKTKKAYALGVTTLPEKCVWSNDSKTAYCSVPESIPKGEYPDLWYQGQVSFSDSLWKVDTENNIFSLIYDPGNGDNEDFDGVSLSLGVKNDYLLLVNKKDDILWSLSL